MLCSSRSELHIATAGISGFFYTVLYTYVWSFSISTYQYQCFTRLRAAVSSLFSELSLTTVFLAPSTNLPPPSGGFKFLRPLTSFLLTVFQFPLNPSMTRYYPSYCKDE